MAMKCRLLLLLTVLSLAPSASGGLIFTVTPSLQGGIAGGDPVAFSGTLVDDDRNGSFLFLNDIRVTFVSPADSYLSTDPSPNPVFLNVPGTLLGDGNPVDDSYSGPIFQVYIAPGTPPGSYPGSIDILGGYNGPDDSTVLAAQTFQVLVPAPEPGVGAVVLAGLAGLAFTRVRRGARGC